MGDALWLRSSPKVWYLIFPTHTCVCTQLAWRIPPGVERTPVKTHSPCFPLIQESDLVSPTTGQQKAVRELPCLSKNSTGSPL